MAYDRPWTGLTVALEWSQSRVNFCCAGVKFEKRNHPGQLNLLVHIHVPHLGNEFGHDAIVDEPQRCVTQRIPDEKIKKSYKIDDQSTLSNLLIECS